MTIQLTDAEKLLVESQRLPDRPDFFSASLQRDQEITEDFETYLILQPTEDKQVIQDWITTSAEIQEENLDRDELLERYLGIRVEDATARITELDIILNNFDNIQRRLLTVGDVDQDPSRFAQVFDIGLLIQSLQKPVDEVNIQREQAFHERTFVTLLTDKLDLSKTTEDTQAELESWQTVISTYEGQPTREQDVGSGILSSF